SALTFTRKARCHSGGSVSLRMPLWQIARGAVVLIPPDSLRLVRIRHLTSRHAREVRCELVPISTVLTRRSTSERAEFTDQMRLVEETKVDGDLCPANRTRVVQAPDNTLKTHDPCKALRRHANFV